MTDQNDKLDKIAEALKPFAEEADRRSWLRGLATLDTNEGYIGGSKLTERDLVRAREALAALASPQAQGAEEREAICLLREIEEQWSILGWGYNESRRAKVQAFLNRQPAVPAPETGEWVSTLDHPQQASRTDDISEISAKDCALASEDSLAEVWADEPTQPETGGNHA